MANDSSVKDDCQIYFELQEAQLLDRDNDGDEPPIMDQNKRGQLEHLEQTYLDKSVEAIVASFLDDSFEKRDGDNATHYEIIMGAYDSAIGWAQMKSLPNADQARTSKLNVYPRLSLSDDF